MSEITISEPPQKPASHRLVDILLYGSVGLFAALDIAGHRSFPDARKNYDQQTKDVLALQARIDPALARDPLNDPGPDGERAARAIVKFMHDSDGHDHSVTEPNDIYYSDHYHHWMRKEYPISEKSAIGQVNQMVDNRTSAAMETVWLNASETLLEGCKIAGRKRFLCSLDPASLADAELMTPLADALNRPGVPKNFSSTVR